MVIVNSSSPIDVVRVQEAFRAVGDLLPEPMLLVTGRGRVIAANPAARSITGYNENELLKTPLHAHTDESREQMFRFLGNCSRSRTMVLGSMSFHSKTGTLIECQVEGCAYRTRSQDLQPMVLLRFLKRDDVDQKYREFHGVIRRLMRGREDPGRPDDYQRKLEYLSYHDVLTGLPNRRLFEKRLDYEWKRAQRDEKTLALILLDIDFFKQYNDTYGHPAGDECLRQVAKTIQSCCKRSADLPARYGGEEFVILLPDTDQEGVILIAEDLRARVELLDIKHKTSAVHNIVTATLGLSVAAPSADVSKQILVAQADKALYFAKRRGRNLIALLPSCKTNRAPRSSLEAF